MLDFSRGRAGAGAATHKLPSSLICVFWNPLVSVFPLTIDLIVLLWFLSGKQKFLPVTTVYLRCLSHMDYKSFPPLLLYVWCVCVLCVYSTYCVFLVCHCVCIRVSQCSSGRGECVVWLPYLLPPALISALLSPAVSWLLSAVQA